MNIRDRQGLKSHAKEMLSCASYPPRKLFGIHIAVSAGITLLISFLTYLLDQGIATTGGLDGIGTRSVLQTAQQLLETASSLALPFWQIGLVFVSLQLIRRQSAEPRSLLEGFRKLGPVLRMNILKTLILVGLALAGSYVSAFVLVLTPLSNGLVTLMDTIPETATEEELALLMEDPAFLEQMVQAMLPMMIAMFVIILALLIPFLYRLRMTDFVLMDNPTAGARAAIKTSWRMTKGNCLALFRLDLSFWWFYILELLLSVLYLMDMYLPLDINPNLYFWLCSVGYAVGQVVLYAWANAQIQTTYAAAYEALLEQERQKEAQRLAAAAAITPWNIPPQPPQQPE